MIDAIEQYAGLNEAREKETKYYGVYPGIVVYVNDPSQRGKIKVRIPGITGNTKQFPIERLPWANPCLPFGGGFDFGTVMVPPVGSGVWVLFAHGNPLEPVWIGSFLSAPSTEKLMLRDPSKKWPKGDISMSPDEETSWIAPGGPNAPIEFLEQVNNSPEHYVPFKTPKGASIDVEDRDEVEKLSIQDRAGQGLYFEAPVRADYNRNNASQRGLSSSSLASGFPVETTITNESKVYLIDLGGQSIELQAKKYANKIIITSKENTEETIEDGKFTYGSNREIATESQVILELASSENKINLEIINKNRTTARLAIDGLSGTIELTSPTVIKVSSENIILDGNVEVNGNLLVNENIVTLNDSTVCGSLISTENKIKTPLKSIDQPSI